MSDKDKCPKCGRGSAEYVYLERKAKGLKAQRAKLRRQLTEAKHEAREWKLTAEQESRDRAEMVRTAKRIAYLEAKSEFRAEAKQLRDSLRRIQSMAGCSPAADACRNIIKEAAKAMKEKVGG